ncbi:MAG: hypothetical protein ACRC8S_21475 [Fimbriiglobus sp.]
MTAKRLLLRGLLGWALVGSLFSGSGFAQTPMTDPKPLSAGTGSPLAPMTTPMTTPMSTGTATAPLLSTMPYTPGTAEPLSTLTAPPGTVIGQAHPQAPGGIMNSSAACCGPTGANGPVTYELYVRTGPSLFVGGGPELSGATDFGWLVEGGGRTLFLNPECDAAWAIDLGVMYAYNDGGDRIIDVFARQPRTPTGQLQGPDQIHPFRVRGITRTGLNYAIGRDWFMNGPGFLGYEQAWNSRVGLDIGGHYGSIRTDLVPIGDPSGYFRRYSIAHGFTVGAHWNTEIPIGNWIAFTGIRAQWGYHWSNIIPPQDGNFQTVNILWSIGVRF